MGYGPQDKSTVLKLTYNYGVKGYDKGDGYGQVSVLNLYESIKYSPCMQFRTSASQSHIYIYIC